MTNKRPTIKGKGADFFFEQKKSTEQGKATFYFSRDLIDKIDDVWVDLRKTYRKLRKSDIARIAIEDLVRDYADKQQDSKLLQHLNVKTSRQH